MYIYIYVFIYIYVLCLRRSERTRERNKATGRSGPKSNNECSEGQHCEVQGRTYDLKSAYKQFGLCSDDRDLLRMAVNKPGAAEPILLGLNALPFGAIGSVAGFLRISFAIWWIGVFGMGIAWSAYFDDYSSLTRPELSSNTHWAITSLFELVGVRYAKDGPKAPPFGDVQDAWIGC